jgi:hypothetical protein
VAHALAVKVHIGLGVDGHAVDSLGGHGRVCKKNSAFDFRLQAWGVIRLRHGSTQTLTRP